MIVATHEEKQPETVVQWLQRIIPFCPKCGRLMNRSGTGRTEHMIRYYKCKPCGITAKTRSRII